MSRSKSTRQPIVLASLTVLIGFGIVAASPVLAQQPPPGGATPGGALPQKDEWELPTPPPELIEIPAVVDRPLGIDEGPRVPVQSFDLDVTEPLASVAGSDLLTQARSLLDSKIAAQPDGGYSIGQLEQIAAQVTELFRNNDFILAWAYLPVQEVSAGAVRVSVLSGRLANVEVEGNKRYSNYRILMPLQDLKGEAVRKSTMERAILDLRAFPGLSPTAVLSPGEETGATDLTIRVTEDRADFRAFVDNYGSELTGEGRARAVIDVFNPFGLGDLFSANVLQTFDPQNGTYGGVSYDVPLYRGDWVLNLAYTKNTYDVAGSAAEEIDLGGDADIATVTITKTLKRSRFFSAFLRTGLEFMKSEVDNVTTTGDDPEDNLTVGILEFDIESVDTLGPGGINQLRVEWRHGFDDFLGSMDSDGDGNSTRRGGSGDLAGGDYDMLVLQYQRLQRVTENNNLLFRLLGQYTDDLLTSLEQFSMGGPYSVRGYPTAEILVDRGAFASLEWIVDVTGLGKGRPENWDVFFSVFADYAEGEVEDPLPGEDDNPDISGWGGSVKMDYRFPKGHSLELRVDAATQISSRDPSDDDDIQWWGHLEYKFR